MKLKAAGALGLFARILWPVALLFVAVGHLCAENRQSDNAPAGAEAAPHANAAFVGSSACAGCHPVQHTEWRASHHAAAMQEASETTVLGRFDGSEFVHNGVTSTFFKRDGKFWVRTDGPDGRLSDFEVRYTFGLTPLQQYLVPMPGGRLQALGVAWDARPAAQGGQRWFHLYPDQKLAAGDSLHWTGVDQNWNYQCAWCHSTNLKKDYDAVSMSFKTTWSEINVGCEACHGPASNHVAWASRSAGQDSPDDVAKGLVMTFDERKDVTWSMGSNGQAFRSVPRATANEIELCATCHARRQQISDRTFTHGRLLDYFRPALLDHGLYDVDGQQRDEVYIYGSFLQSRMHAAGVTCSDCHNPHSGELRASGNAVCSQCHASERFDSPTHHRHAAGSAGAQCTACHMPPRTYMGVDLRHDHSMRIPRPDRTRLVGTPNACHLCHTDKSAAWASDAIKTWQPHPKKGYQTFAEAFDLADRGAPGAQAALTRVLEDHSQSPMARASAIARLGRFPSAKSMAVISRSLKDEDPLVRMAAVEALSAAHPDVRLVDLVPMLTDAAAVVRMDAARALAGELEPRLSPEDRRRFELALAEYVAAQNFNAERPESQTNLGNLWRRRGLTAKAEAAFLRALAIDRSFVPAAIELAELRRSQGDENAAEQVLTEAIAASPQSAPLLHALGLSLVRQKRIEEATVKLGRAADLAPEDPHLAYVHAVALHDTGQADRAREVLNAALSRHPYDREVLQALASFDFAGGDPASALQRAELLHELEPENPEIARLRAMLKHYAR